MNEKLIWQVVDIFRGNVGSDEIYTFAYQLLAWVRLSKLGKLSGVSNDLGKASDQLFDPNYPPRDIKALTQKFNRLAENQNLKNAHAFGHTGTAISQITPGQLLQALELLNASNLTEAWPVKDLVKTLTFKSYKNNNALPEELSNLMIALCELQTGDEIYLPFEQNYQLTAHALEFGGVPFTETIVAGPTPWLINILSDQDIFIHIGDSIKNPGYLENGRLRRFGLCVGFPPLGYRYELAVSQNDRFQRFHEETTAIAVLAMRHIMARTSHRAVVAVPNGLLFSPGAERSLRDDLINRRMIEAVIALPPALMPGTTLTFSLLVLRLDSPVSRIYFIDGAAEKLYSKDGRGRATLTGWKDIIHIFTDRVETRYARSVSFDEVIANDVQLQVSRYCRNDELEAVHALLTKYETEPLLELVTFQRPVPLVKDDGIDVFEFGPADFPEFGYASVPGRVVKISEAKNLAANRQFLKRHDIVITIKGSVGKVAIIPTNAPKGGQGGWIAGQSCIALRVEDASIIDPRVLFTFLKSDAGQLLLKQIVSGAAVPLIQLRELGKIKIPIPTKPEQEKLITEFEEISTMEEAVTLLRKGQAEKVLKMWSNE